MSPKDFIKKGFGADQIEKAARQQNQLQYLTVSDIQENINENYIEQFSTSKYLGQDPMLSWVWNLFKVDNFKSFYKYLRFPVSSSRLCNDEIEKSMERVFFSDDGFKKFIVNGSEIEAPDYLEDDEFKKEIFNALLYRHNDIIVHDLDGDNTPFRNIIDINDVVSIILHKNTIKKIAYKRVWDFEGSSVSGHIYMDSEVMAFIPSEDKFESIIVPHDIEQNIATFISPKPFNTTEPIVRDCIFSRVRPLLEEYVFLTTLRIMSDANGSFPIVVKLATQAEGEDDNTQGEIADHPMSSWNKIGGEGHKIKRNSNALQAGSVHEVPAQEKDGGAIDMDVVKNYINFFRTPVDSLEYVDKRIESTKKEIIRIVVGDYSEGNDTAKNEMQVSKSYLAKQDRLRSFGFCMSWSITNSDTIMLKLANGTDVSVDYSMGTDFFIETQSDLFSMFATAPNPIEKSSVLLRLAKLRGQNNQNRMQRDVILYKLVPFVDTKDFEYSVGLNIVPPEDILLQTKFQYFITTFESNYGDIVEFYNNLGSDSDSEKITQIKNLLYELVNEFRKVDEEDGVGSTESPLSIAERLNAYGTGVRSGAITPQTVDEKWARDEIGLPPLSENGLLAWKNDNGVRRPITLKGQDAIEAEEEAIKRS